MHEHAHEHREAGTIPRLIAAIGVNIVITAAEAIGGFFTGSLALLSDAGHNLSDVFALIFSLIGAVGEKQKSTREKSYGFHRAEVLVAALNALILIGVAAFIFLEAYQRLNDPPQAIDFKITALLGIFALGGNLAGIFFLRRKRRFESINIRAAILHLAADALTSLGVVVSALLIFLTGNFVFDTIVSVIIGVVILWSGWSVIYETVHILLEGTPRHIKTHEVEAAINVLPEVKRVHDLHIWSLSSTYTILSAHIAVPDQKLSQSVAIKQKIETMLKKHFNITHATLQLEAYECGENETLCKKIESFSA